MKKKKRKRGKMNEFFFFKRKNSLTCFIKGTNLDKNMYEKKII